ncbi:unnamed protein product [Protopolystoma xenopodis]|uniref:Uncharacterized protein n=1 Tax=Protopolystoma xenopodis TaxID=117903 RepID=A0A448XMB7_9PLAT|nr:unnamed protein product [Protopolystoma xenopodis]
MSHSAQLHFRHTLFSISSSHLDYAHGLLCAAKAELLNRTTPTFCNAAKWAGIVTASTNNVPSCRLGRSQVCRSFKECCQAGQSCMEHGLPVISAGTGALIPDRHTDEHTNRQPASQPDRRHLEHSNQWGMYSLLTLLLCVPLQLSSVCVWGGGRGEVYLR